ncbi:MAG: hypothetical protein RLZZ68_420 [Bacteroidota bacterium]|jgi:hypothetical protein|nr:hypothetical protein [Flavobacteriia bacterium]NBP28482.1 hypothetical protein [Flavobacteriia bacterium]
MDYPIIPLDQLKELEKELVAFLIVHGIDGDLWKSINEENPEKAMQLVQLFSNTVWEKIADQTTAMKRMSANETTFIRIGTEEGFLLNVQNNDGKLTVHTGKKSVDGNRREQVIELLTQGFERISSEEFSEALKNFLPEKSVKT